MTGSSDMKKELQSVTHSRAVGVRPIPAGQALEQRTFNTHVRARAFERHPSSWLWVKPLQMCPATSRFTPTPQLPQKQVSTLRRQLVVRSQVDACSFLEAEV